MLELPQYGQLVRPILHIRHPAISNPSGWPVKLQVDAPQIPELPQANPWDRRLAHVLSTTPVGLDSVVL